MRMEWIEGSTVRNALNEWLRTATITAKECGKDPNEVEVRDPALVSLMTRIGEAVGKLHAVGVIHGDLTTSNLMLSPSHQAKGAHDTATPDLSGDVVLIDFGASCPERLERG